MKSDVSILKLQEEIDKRIEVAANSLLNRDQTSAKENIEWIETASILLGKIKQKSNKPKWAIFIGLASVFIIGLGITLRIPKTNISIDIESRSVSFKLRTEWIMNYRFSPSELYITNLKEIYAPGANIKVSEEQPFNMNLKGSSIVIDKFVFSPNAEITIQSENSTQIFSIKNDTLVSNIEVGAAHLDIDNGRIDTLLNFEIPETFAIKSYPSVAIPIDILVVDTANWRFRDMLISSINFLEENTSGNGKFSSSIISGKVKILETDQETGLEEGDWLLLEKLKTRRIQIAKSMTGLKIHIEGEVSQASAGSELFEKKLNPTIIEYLYYAKSLAFFWSSIVFICSLAWSLRNIFFSANSN